MAKAAKPETEPEALTTEAAPPKSKEPLSLLDLVNRVPTYLPEYKKLLARHDAALKSIQKKTKALERKRETGFRALTKKVKARIKSERVKAKKAKKKE